MIGRKEQKKYLERGLSKMPPKEKLPVIVEEEDTNKANVLALSNDFCQPRFSEKRNCYIFIRKKR